MTPSQPNVRHVIALPQIPKVGKPIFEYLKDDENKKHWEVALEHQFAKNATQQVL